jgi:flagellar motor protein MotB
LILATLVELGKLGMKLRSAALLFSLALVSSGCVAQQRYDQALRERDYYKKQYQDLSSFHGQLEAQNAGLKGELEIYQGKATIESGYVGDIDERLAQLKALTERITSQTGAAPGDVEFVAVEGGYGVRVTDAVLFDKGSSAIRAEGQAILAKVAQEIASKPFQRLWVRGHTDSDPVVRPETLAKFPHGNLQLSAERAVEVGAFLGKNGVTAGKIVVAGFGPGEPVAKNDSEDGKRKNRRVEIFVLEDASAEAR